MNVALFIFAGVSAPVGLLLLYAAVWHGGRFSTRYERAWALVSGAGWTAVAGAFAVAATASGSTRTALLVAGGVSGVAAAFARLVIVSAARRS